VDYKESVIIAVKSAPR